jgi:hypothetical protein
MQSNQMRSVAVGVGTDRTLRQRINEVMEMAARVQSESQSVVDACFGAGPQESSEAIGHPIDLSASIEFIAARLAGALNSLERVSTSLSDGKAARSERIA